MTTGTQSPPRPRGLHHLAVLRTLFTDPPKALEDLNANQGPVSSLGFGPVRIAIVGDPTALRELTSMPNDRFRWGHKFNVLGFVVGPGSMIVSDGPDHRRRRASVQSAFSRRRLDGWVPMILDRADATADRLIAASTGPAVDITPELRTLVMGIAVHAFFGEHTAERIDEIASLFVRPQRYLESSAIRQIPHPIPRTARAHARSDRRALDVIIDEEIRRRRERVGDDSSDVLDVLVRDGSLTDSEIRDQVVTLIGAGYDTTAAALAWTLLEATTTPGVWDRLRHEADATFGDDNDADTLRALVFADRVMHESLRLHPPGAFAPREALADLTIGQHTIRQGTLVLWSAYLAGRDPRSWDDPLRFDPDRFDVVTDEQRAIIDQAWVPFGRGPRMCIGFALAQMELTLIAARMAQRLDITRSTSDMPRPNGMVVNRPTGGVVVQVRPRVTT